MNDLPKKNWDDEKHAFEVWKYYGGIGGTDKDTMIKIVTWMLGFSTAIIGVYASGEISDSFAKVLFVILGILVSGLAAFTAILYGAYATWNWSIADRIAESYDWSEQKPDYRPILKSKSSAAIRLAQPCQNKIAPVFWVFFGVSVASLIVHVLLLLHAIRVVVIPS
jgi:hypothetical protein